MNVSGPTVSTVLQKTTSAHVPTTSLMVLRDLYRAQSEGSVNGHNGTRGHIAAFKKKKNVYAWVLGAQIRSRGLRPR